ncbi:hypothetical protein AB0909_28630 [Streptomyces albidoflavus]|uniref:hypothetical protein n=1 Tax=Streptomyces albidoflavus TaxID=1886 RepID=UPI003453D744
MSTARLSAAEIVNELLLALADDGWLTTSTAPAGPGPVTSPSGLATVAEALRSHSRAGVLPPAAARELLRAANATDRAAELEDTADPVVVYGELGTALAHLVQARGACATTDSPESVG